MKKSKQTKGKKSRKSRPNIKGPFFNSKTHQARGASQTRQGIMSGSGFKGAINIG